MNLRSAGSSFAVHVGYDGHRPAYARSKVPGSLWEKFNNPHGLVILKEMDDVDRKFMMVLLTEPRIRFRELAKRLGISRQAVYRRAQVLMETGVIKGSSADISVPYLGAIPVAVFGTSKRASNEETLDRLGRNDLTRRIVVAGGNYLYVAGILRNMSELESYAEFVKRTASMQEPTVGIYSDDERLMPDYVVDGIGKRKGKESFKKLAPLDLRIIAALKDDARRSLAQIADTVGASTKTVRRHLQHMTDEGSLDLHVRSDEPAGGYMMFLIHVNLTDRTDKGEFARRLLLKHPSLDAYMRAFSNIPNFLIWVFWTDKLTEMREVLKDLNEDHNVVSTMANFAYLERIYPTWRHKLPVLETRPSMPTRPVRRHRSTGAPRPKS